MPQCTSISTTATTRSMRDQTSASSIRAVASRAAVRGGGPVGAAARPASPRTERTKRLATEKELQSIAIVERKVMMPMRDGVRLATDIYRPKNAPGKVPIVFVRTPYNFNFWDVRNGVPADMTAALDRRQARLRLRRPERARPLLLRGQLRHPRRADHRRLRRDRLAVEAAVVERQGRHDRLLVDRRVAAGASRRSGIPAFAAMNVQGFGAGVGRVGPYYEQGNWYRGGAVQMLFITWLYGEQNQVRPMFPQDTPQEDLIARVAAVRPRAADAAGGLVQGAVAPAGAGHHQERRRPARHLRRRDAGRRPAAG